MDYIQPDLLGGQDDDPAGMRVERPVPRAHPGWEYVGTAGRRKKDCAHCQMLWACDDSVTVRKAAWVRYGRWGSELYLCRGHRARQLEADQAQPSGG